jgi:hypothetical protein
MRVPYSVDSRVLSSFVVAPVHFVAHHGEVRARCFQRIRPPRRNYRSLVPPHYFCRKADGSKRDAASEGQTFRWPRAAYRLLLVRYSENDGSGMHQASAITSDGDGVVAKRSVLTTVTFMVDEPERGAAIELGVKVTV